jgi:hypothetical protein
MARTSQERKRHQATAAAGVLDSAAATAARAGARDKAPARPRRPAPQTAAANGRDQLHTDDAGIAEPSLTAGLTETAEAALAPLDPPIAEPPGQENLVLPDAAGPQPATPHPLHGYIDEASWTGIKGWVWDPQLPTERIRLELMDGETRLATALASENRPGLILSGIGDGRHGFSIALEPGELQEGRHVLRLRSADTGAEVPGSPIVLEPNLKSAGPQDIAAATDLAAPAIGELAGTGLPRRRSPGRPVCRRARPRSRRIRAACSRKGKSLIRCRCPTPPQPWCRPPRKLCRRRCGTRAAPKYPPSPRPSCRPSRSAASSRV